MTEIIEIKLPLSATTFTGVCRGLNAVWPDAVILTDQVSNLGCARIQVEGAGSPSVNLADIEIGDNGWVPPPGLDVDAYIKSIHDGTFGMTFPEWFSRLMREGCRAVLDEHPDAQNYVEVELHDPATGERWAITVTKSTGKTPHELRLEAETERDEALAQLSALTDQL